MKVPFLQIEPTNLCNLSCVMCTRRDLKRFGSMSLENLQSLVSRVPGLEAVKLQGMGEPMLNPDIVPMMRYLHDNSIHTYTVMNGTVLPPEGIDDLMQVVNRIEFSLDTLDPEEYRRLRGRDEIETVLENLALLCRARERYPDVMISLNCVLFGESRERLGGLFDLARRLGIDRIDFNVMQNWSIREDDPSRCECDLDVVENLVSEMSARHAVAARLHRPIEGYAECKWSRTGCYITWDGYVTPCCQRPNPCEINFGNVFLTGFSPVYESRRYRDFRESLECGSAPAECESCSAYVNKQVEDGSAVSCKP